MVTGVIYYATTLVIPPLAPLDIHDSNAADKLKELEPGQTTRWQRS